MICPGSTTHNGLYGEVPPERGTFLRDRHMKGVGISLNKVYKRLGKSVILVFIKGQKALTDTFYDCENVEETFIF